MGDRDRKFAYSGAKVQSRFYLGDLVTRTGDREIGPVSGRVGMYVIGMTLFLGIL